MIVVDLQALQSPAYATRGVGRYVGDLVRTLETEHLGHVGSYVYNGCLPRGEILDRLDADLALGARLQSGGRLRGREVDVLHVLAPFAPLTRASDEAVDYLDWHVPVRARRLAVTVYDLIPWQYPDRYLADTSDRARYHHRLAIVPAADAVLTLSHAVADDLVRMLGVAPARVDVVGGGASDVFAPPTRSRAERRAALADLVPVDTHGFVLAVGAPDWRKNLDGAVAAFARLDPVVRRANPLVVAAGLGSEDAAAIRQLAAELGVAAEVVVPGFVNDELLATLYQAASVVVVPSRAEGFGLPILEGRACGARVICSDIAAFAELLPEPAARFDPDDIDDIAGCLARALSDGVYQSVLDDVSPPAHSWSDAASLTVAAHRRLHSSLPSRNASNCRMRVGVVTPLPPAATGVADHGERLVAALAQQVHVTVFTPSVPATLARADGVSVRPIAALPTAFAAGEVDHVLYCIGNGVVHRPQYDALRSVPGAVLLHDVALPYLYGPAGPGRVAPNPHDDRSPYASAWPVVSLATVTLVQSRHATELVRAATGVDAIDIGPHPCWNDGVNAPIDDGDGPWVVSAGIAHEAKQSDRVVAAARILRDMLPDVAPRLALVGDGGARFVDDPCVDGDVDTRHIVCTGHVNAAEFDRWLRRATVMVQLRASSNGESSGVVAHAMARGVPLVVTDIGAMSELPEAVAVRVPVDVTPSALAEVIADLLGDPARRESMRSAALGFAASETADAQAARIVEALSCVGVSR